MKIIDFSFEKRYWGNDFQLGEKLDDEGYEWSIAIWYHERPKIGDHVLLGLASNKTRKAVIEKVEACGNPNDMYFLDVKIIG